ncbi:MmgE/PrpD family protein [Rhodococcus rhodochrous]|uniref:MmgE/PrpD family protein n=1 Tax=Rhodococcus rhodochrous TaxID=1829 RepID=UPI0003107BF7|nr:MmgE/PrpD family protein [Rhodococcus rhodochrous]
MTPEDELIAFIHETRLEDLPPEAQRTVATMVSTNIGTLAAGADEAGCTQLRKYLLVRGGREEATVLVHGDRLPAAAAAQLNATMARALDYEDAMVPGLHLGAALIPAAFACAELRGGVDGAEFLTAVAVGAEVGARLNLPDRLYNGFDPTGIAGPIAAAATASRLLGLSPDRIHHALGLAFNRTAGSFQSNIDGSLAVRLIQGWVAESGVMSAQLAEAGLTGPTAFLDGLYGYAQLYTRGEIPGTSMTTDLGNRWDLTHTGFKKYPSCGLTQGTTELALRAYADGARPDTVEHIEVAMTPYGHRLVGHPFVPGENPRVAAQFSASYCAAGALLHGAARLEHFTPDAILDPDVLDLAKRVSVRADSDLDERGHGATRLTIHTTDGDVVDYGIDAPPGFPDNPLSPDDHEHRLRDCLSAASRTAISAQTDQLVELLRRLDELDDVTTLIELLTA